MVNQVLSDQRGSIAPLGVTLLAAVLILAIAILEREWVTYQVALAEQTADFAAEAAVRMHEATATIEVDYYQWWEVSRLVCPVPLVEGKCPVAEITVWDRHDTTDRRQFTARIKDLRGDGWRQVAGCGPDGRRPNWYCTDVKEVRQEIQFTEQAEPLARQVFFRNWQNRPSISIENDSESPFITFNQGMVTVRVEAELRPLFGLMAWSYRLPIEGSAVAKAEALFKQKN